MIRRLRPTGAWVLLTLAPALTFIAVNIDRNYQTDLWHHLVRGREIVRHGEILDRDVFTFTVTDQPFRDPNWLTQVIFYELFRLGGLPFLQLVNATVLTATVALLVYLAVRASGSERVAGFMGVFAFLGVWQLFLIRPQTLSLFFFSLLYLILDLAPGRRWLLCVPPVLLGLWANVHGAFPIGCFLIGAFLLAHGFEGWSTRGKEVLRDPMTWGLCACLAVSILATCANPYGWNVYQFVVGTPARASERNIQEWLPPSMKLFIGKVFVASLMLLLFLFAFSRRRPSVRDVCLALCFLPLAASAVRMIGWWVIVVTPILAAQLAAVLPRSWIEDPDLERATFADGAFWGILVLAMALSVPGLQHFNPLLRIAWRDHRVEDDLQVVAEHLQRSQETGRIFCRLEWGACLSWALFPSHQVFLDGRIDIFPDNVWQEYYAVTEVRADWEEILDRYGVNYLVLDNRMHGNLIAVVERSPRWQRTLEQGPARLYERRTNYTPRGER